MVDLLRLFSDMSTFLKLAWAGWLVWCAVQIVWYRRARVLPAAPEPLSRDQTAERPLASAVISVEPPRAPTPPESAPGAQGHSQCLRCTRPPVPVPAPLRRQTGTFASGLNPTV